jgi:hypothetical protein
MAGDANLSSQNDIIADACRACESDLRADHGVCADAGAVPNLG